MRPAINTVVIQTYRRDVEHPGVGQRVRIDGIDGLYLVVSIDNRSQTADLMRLSGISSIESNVAFARLRPVPRAADGVAEKARSLKPAG